MAFSKILNRRWAVATLVMSVLYMVVLNLGLKPGYMQPSSWFLESGAPFDAKVQFAEKTCLKDKLSMLIPRDAAESVRIMNDKVAIPVLFFGVQNLYQLSQQVSVVEFFCRGYPGKKAEHTFVLPDYRGHVNTDEVECTSSGKLFLPIRAGTYLIFASVAGQDHPLGVVTLKANALGECLRHLPQQFWSLSTHLNQLVVLVFLSTVAVSLFVDQFRYSKTPDAGGLLEDVIWRLGIAFAISLAAASFPPIRVYLLGLLYLSALPASVCVTHVKNTCGTLHKKIVSFAPIKTEAPLVLNKVYFPGLNQVRALAAFSVIFCHVEQIKRWYGIDYACPLLESPGGDGVTLFFVLSGFLITFLLLQEQVKCNKIDLKKFYLRRVCRIWPLYFFVVFNAFFVLPHFWHAPAGFLADQAAALHDSFWTKLTLYACFLPGLCSIIYPPILFASQCWSLGVEEQLYMFWPLLVVLSRRFFVWAALFVIGARSAVLYWIDLCSKSYQADDHMLHQLKALVVQFDADAFIIGGLAAWLMTRRPNFVQKWFQHPIVLVAITVTVFFCVCSCPTSAAAPWHCSFQPPLVRTAFALMILAFAQRPVKFGSLTNFVDHLGRVSYGLYMYHWGVAVFVAQWLLYSRNRSDFNLADEILFYSITIALTICISSLSFKYLEQPFLRMKRKLAVIQTI